MSYYTTKASVPQSFVTKGKQRLKQYTDTVYLNNGDEFEIELYNPTLNKVLAKIELNGNSIGKGIVLRPGERVFLERYLDEARKFLFETYEVEGNDDEVRHAIMKNGLVKVTFHNEQIHVSPTTWFDGGYKYPYISDNNRITFTSSGNLGMGTTSPSEKLSITATNSNNYTCFSNTSVTNDSSMNTKSLRSSITEKSNSIETGRVEKGSTSNQSFMYDSTTFNPYSSYVSSWKILPKSQKVLVKEELSVYCTECGSKRKKDSHKFCPHCGTKF